MNKHFSPLLLALPIAALAGCADEVPTGAVAGVVADWLTGNPVVGANVTFYQGAPKEAETDNKGGFFFGELEDPEGMLVVSAAGYRTAQTSVGVDDCCSGDAVLVGDDNDGAQLHARNDIAVADVMLIPNNLSLAGTVTYNGDGFEGATVSALCGERYLTQAQTAAGGVFELPGLELCVYDQSVESWTVMMSMDVDGDGLIDYTYEQQVNAGSTGDPNNVQFNIDDEVETDTERVISGHVFFDEWTPAEGAEVVLAQGYDILAGPVTAGAEGAFTFGTVGVNLGQSYTVYGLPFDADGDGWADTGTDSVTISWTSMTTNVLLDLPASSHDMMKSNVCDPNPSYHTLLEGDDLYFLWNASMNTDLTSFQLIGPDGTVLPTTHAWHDNYLLTVTPDPALVASSDPDDLYTMRFDSIVYADGYVEVRPDLADDYESCSFRVGGLPTFLDEPVPMLYLHDGETDYVVDASEIRFFDADGNYTRTRSATDLELVFDHTPGADRYEVWAQQSNADITSGGTDGSWQYLGDIDGESRVNDLVYGTVSLYGFSGGFGDVFDLGNGVDLLVKPVGDDGHVEQILGDEPKLSLMDTQSAIINELAWGSTGYGFTTATLQDFRFNFREDMDISTAPDPAGLVPVGGRLSNPVAAGSAFWGSAVPQAVSATAFFGDVTFDITMGAPITLSSSDGDTVFAASELGGALNGWAMDQTIGLYDATSGSEAVYYGRVTDINTIDGSMTTSFSFPSPTTETGDVLFDPCASGTTVTSEAQVGTDILNVASSTGFFIGQSIEVGALSGSEYHTIEDIVGSALHLVAPLSETQEVGSTVEDWQCGSGPGTPSRTLRTDTRYLVNGDDRLITPTELGASTNSLTFNTSVNLNGLLPGDMIRVDGDGDYSTHNDRLIATISGIRTVDAAGDPLEDANDPSNNTIQVLHLSGVTPLGTTALPILVDPSALVIEALTDGVQYAGSVMDTSGNAGLDTGADNEDWGGYFADQIFLSYAD